MSSKVSIANMAASLIGEDDQLVAFEDDTHLGRSVRAVWDLCRQDAIRDHLWNFAMRREGLTAQAGIAVPWPWAYSHRLPADCLRLVEVLNLGQTDWQLEGGAVLCNDLGPVYIRYLTDVDEPALWDPMFAAAFARRLAVVVGKRIAGTAYDVAEGWKLYRAALNEAKRADARENPPVDPDLSGWELARMGGAMTDPAQWG